MRRILLCFLCLLSVSAQAQALKNEHVQTLSAWLLDRQKKDNLPVVGLTLVEGKEVRFAAASSLTGDKSINAQTPFEAPALTEPLTSLLACVLEQERLVSLSDPAHRLDSRFQTTHSDKGRAITLTHLFHMNAGISPLVDQNLTEGWAKNAEDVYTVIRQTPAQSLPGLRYENSEASVAAAGYLMASAAGFARNPDNGYAELVRTRLFGPLGMTGSSITPGPLAPARGLKTTVGDLSKWLVFELAGGRLSNGQILASPTALALRRAPQHLSGARQRCMGFYEQFYEMTPVVARASYSEKSCVIIGMIPQYQTGFALYAEGPEAATRKLVQEIPLALVEFLREKEISF